MKKFTAPLVMLLAAASLLIFSCKKETDQKKQQQEIASTASPNSGHGHLLQTKTYSSEVVFKWIDLYKRILQTTTRIGPGVLIAREFGYAGIALYESVGPGMPAYQSLSSQLNQMPQMPSTEPVLAILLVFMMK